MNGDETKATRFVFVLVFELDDGTSIEKTYIGGQACADALDTAARLGLTRRIKQESNAVTDEIYPWHRVRRVVRTGEVTE